MAELYLGICVGRKERRANGLAWLKLVQVLMNYCVLESYENLDHLGPFPISISQMRKPRLWFDKGWNQNQVLCLVEYKDVLLECSAEFQRRHGWERVVVGVEGEQSDRSTGWFPLTVKPLTVKQWNAGGGRSKSVEVGKTLSLSIIWWGCPGTPIASEYVGYCGQD